ncbi:hypothetical protein JXM83_00565 [Candidatus Woesearchaeota archaeon]|nr:hypothetical protein [Candidatus Woesearchaeota archaeon]
MFRGKYGEMGIGTLVLFIAMILVAAIAAGVLIQTATNLQSKALETGSRSTRQVATAVSTVLMYGQDGSDGYFDEIRQNIKLVAGSDPIKFNDSILTVDTANQSADLVYNASGDNNCTGTFSADEFRVAYLKNGTNHIQGYFNVGDIVQLCYDAPRNLGSDELLRVSFIPKVGSVMTVRITTPPVVSTARVFLYP